MENLRVYLLGTFRLYRDGVLLTSKDWQIRHARQLFKLLFTERGHSVPASKVIDLLWPYSAEHTHKTLRGVVSILRSVLEPERAVGEPSRFVPRGSKGYTLQLPTDGTVWVDSIEFERLLDETTTGHESPKRRRLLESALQLYTGDYLAEDEDESWTLAERARLRERYFSSALSLMEVQRKLSLYNEAISVGRRALSLDICREPLYPLIMYCQAALGDTVGALQTFEQCRQELHNRLGVDPSPQTLKLHTELLRGEMHVKPVKQPSTALKQPTTHPTGASVPSVQISNGTKKHTHDPHMVGRKDILEHIQHYVDALQDKQARPRTRAIALVGEMGIGKSFLLRHILNAARNTHIVTLLADCSALEQGLSFVPLLVMIKAWLAESGSDELASLPNSALAVLAHLLPELKARIPGLLLASFLSAEQAYSNLITSLVDLFQALGQLRPCIVAVDNLQWADEASLLVLHRLARASTIHTASSQHSPLLLLLAYRPEDVQEGTPLSTMLLSLSRCSYFHPLHLSPFSLHEVGDYLNTHTLAQICPADQCYQITQGNAFFLTEAAHLLVDRADQKEHEADARDTVQSAALLAILQHSTKVRDAVLARLARLPERAIELLEQAAVIGRPFPPALLGSPLSAEDYKLLDLLIARHFLIEQSADDQDLCLAFAHQLVAKIIYFNCTALKRSQLHLRTAERLVRHYADYINLYSPEIAFHYRQAGPQYYFQTIRYDVGN